MAWTNIANGNLDVGSPVRSVDILALRDNIPALANGDSGAPKIKNAAYDAGSITADKLSGNQSGSAPAFAARAWVNFNSIGTLSIRGSGNVSSVTDNGIGRFTVNYANAMPNTNYVMVCNVNHFGTIEAAGSHANLYGLNVTDGPQPQASLSTTNVQVAVYGEQTGPDWRDALYILVAIFG